MKLLASLLLVGMNMATNIAVLIFGWGLTPQSWMLIIGGAILGLIFLFISVVINQK
jgi:mannose/fructose/N-acetylgalactosamine-specific phosphotransferase system component IIC